MKKNDGGPPTLALAENPDILKTLAAAGNRRPALVVGFAAETEKVVENAAAKRRRKGCDWMLANAVSPATGTFGRAAHTPEDQRVGQACASTCSPRRAPEPNKNKQHTDNKYPQ